jgi:mono/diheme cytochrome c family protein
MFGRSFLGVMGLLLLSWPVFFANADDKAELLAVQELMAKAGRLFTESKFKEAGEVVTDTQVRVAKLAEEGDQATIAQLTPIHKRLEVAHAKLKSEGISLPALAPLMAPKAKAKVAAKTAPEKPGSEKTVVKTTAKAKASPAKSGGMNSVSFVSDVAPILNNRCGGCHIRAAKGAFSMNTYDMLMKGPQKSGKVIFPGDTKSSILIEKIVEKEMPPNGAGIPAAELTTLQKWIQEGAKFDGKDPAAQVSTYVTPSTNATRSDAASIQQATGKETVSFARDIAPLFVAHCIGCHGPQQPRNNFNLGTVTALFKGGDRGEPVLPGKSADSLLIKKLKGTAEGMRMPQRAAPLSDVEIAKISKWIDEGAKFDAPDPNQPLGQVASIAKAQAATHEQLSKDRAVEAEENWRLGMPGTTARKHESANFLVMGSLGENYLVDTAKRAEAVALKVADTFKAPRDQPLVKGRVTLFLFDERYDYGEFGKMVEKHDLPPSLRGHSRFNIVDAYAVVLRPKTDEYDLDTLIAQQLAAVYVASLGKGVPHWFSEGCGRVVASRMAPASDRRVAQWDEELSGLVGSSTTAEDFLSGKMPPESADVCSASFVKFLMSDRQFVNLIDALRKGGEFKKAFSETMGGTPEKLAAAWIRNPPKLGRGGGRTRK